MRQNSADHSNPTVVGPNLTSPSNEGPSFHFLRLSLSTAIVFHPLDLQFILHLKLHTLEHSALTSNWSKIKICFLT